MMNQRTRDYIDGLTYEEMLRKMRYAPVGDPMFQGETGEYFLKVMGQKRDRLATGEHTAISKRIGWDD